MVPEMMVDLPPHISIVGRTNAGKTHLICLLIVELTKRGFRVGTLKHDVHGFEMDVPGKDTWRHREAGAEVVMISSKERFAFVRKTNDEVTPLVLLRRYFHDIDVVLIEGYKKMPFMKVEVSSDSAPPLCSFEEDNLIALVSNRKLECPVPVFSWEEIESLTDLIIEKLGLTT